MNNKIAILLLTQKGYIAEANLIINKLNQFKNADYVMKKLDVEEYFH